MDPNVRRFTGFADIYDQYRPRLPSVIGDILLQLAGPQRPLRVVDIACGTGLIKSQSDIAELFKSGLSDEDIGLSALRKSADAVLSGHSVPWFWSYQIRLAVK